MKQVFVTGAAGFLAGHLIEGLLKGGYEVTGLVKPHHDTKLLDSLKVKYEKGSILEQKDYEHLVPQGGTVIHCYSLGPGANASKEVYNKENVEATKQLLDVCGRKNLKQFVYIGSLSVIGPKATKNNLMDEETRPIANTNYGLSKLAAEKEVKEFYQKFNTPTMVLRLATLYGPRCRKDAASLRIFKMVKKPYALVLDGGKNYYEFNYIKNVAYGITQALQNHEEGYGLYNIGDNVKRTFKDVLLAISDLINPKLKIISVPSLLLSPFAKIGDGIGRVKGKRFKFDSRTFFGLKGGWATSYDKAVKELKLDQAYSMEQGVEETVEWMRKEGII